MLYASSLPQCNDGLFCMLYILLYFAFTYLFHFKKCSLKLFLTCILFFIITQNSNVMYINVDKQKTDVEFKDS